MGNECCSCLFNVNPTEELARKSAKKKKAEKKNRDAEKILLHEDIEVETGEDEMSLKDKPQTAFNPFKRSAGKALDHVKYINFSRGNEKEI
jgi:hypothetical protein